MTTHLAIARAHSNIALIKYWGKSDAALNLPAVPSLSLTLDGLTTTTRVHFAPELAADHVELDGAVVGGREHARVVALLDRVRKQNGLELRASVVSRNDFPTAAGLASSASGFAALALAASSAAGLALSLEAVSGLARQSSASAARSLFGGFASLPAASEHAHQVAPEGHWDLRLLVAVTEEGRKPLGSTEAMEVTKRESPYYSAWVAHAPGLYREAEQAIREKQFDALGTCMEQSTMMMHASMWATRPAIVFFTDATLAVVHRVRALRNQGLPCYFTIDAGPHVKVLAEAEHAPALQKELAAMSQVKRVIPCRAGPGARLVSDEGAAC
ncbi:MAG TPA: diphosphomevalonate decarboxylase [Polyangiaceae bacterium]|nr:diphosphomevalonate decarboxylase [Polyangiaceae bacterium]